MYTFRKQIEQDVLSSHGDATRYFVTFLDNHDVKARIRFVQPGNPTPVRRPGDDGHGLPLFACPAFPASTTAPSRGFTARQRDPAVREALWGSPPPFPKTASFTADPASSRHVRSSEPALRYGRFYFRPISGDSVNFSVSPFPAGVLAWSRILNDQEVLVVANTNTSLAQPPVDVILEWVLSAPGDQPHILYSNKTQPTAPGPVRLLSGVTVAEVDGTTGTGPLHTTSVTLQPMEVQILQK